MYTFSTQSIQPKKSNCCFFFSILSLLIYTHNNYAEFPKTCWVGCNEQLTCSASLSYVNRLSYDSNFFWWKFIDAVVQWRSSWLTTISRASCEKRSNWMSRSVIYMPKSTNTDLSCPPGQTTFCVSVFLQYVPEEGAEIADSCLLPTVPGSFPYRSWWARRSAIVEVVTLWYQHHGPPAKLPCRFCQYFVE